PRLPRLHGQHERVRRARRRPAWRRPSARALHGRLGRDGTSLSLPVRGVVALSPRLHVAGALRRPLPPGGEVMRGPVTAFVLAFGSAFLLLASGAASAYHTRFVALNCTTSAGDPTPYITRDGSINVALRARFEGYQWGGGCWNDNDVDDSPGDPTEDPNTGGEGGDCSGFTFKVWRESETESNAGFYQWNKLWKVHGPYTAAAFKSGAGAPNITIAKSSA